MENEGLHIFQFGPTGEPHGFGDFTCGYMKQVLAMGVFDHTAQGQELVGKKPCPRLVLNLWSGHH